MISFLASRAAATFGIPLNPLDLHMSIVGAVCGSFLEGECSNFPTEDD